MQHWVVEGFIFLSKPGLGIIETFRPLYMIETHFFERRAMHMLPKSYIFH
jgi:hypothetical protein